MNNKALILTLTAAAFGNMACDGGVAEDGFVTYEQSVVVEEQDVVVVVRFSDKLPADLVDRVLGQFVVKVDFAEVVDSEQIIRDPLVLLKTPPGYVATIPSALERDLKELAEEYETEAQLRMTGGNAPNVPPAPVPQAPRR